ncbi:hypothetical protein [Sinorhizobium americanum]|uniref:Transmembrane anchored protein n=1 Tax=Sinorhizobium americanum TaxID=194963 RepID=A0A1L3LL81_9HYPH|nr:hypothetical protein [Sinorhizobium americanum]APG90841.1 transmembrane anchored protein [Sinorhizobium americanum]OAP46732.1 hypothetical protein ATC00_17590 [Sinorhizobium americanum]
MNEPLSPQPELAPLLSPRLAYMVIAAVGLLATLVLAISLSTPWLGEKLARAGHTSSRESLDIFIGQDHLRLPANVIRFDSQRATGVAERVDLYLTWPTLEGYSDATRHVFNDVDQPERLIFIQISQSTMSRDMSGRLEPIYRHILEESAQLGPAGLTKYDAKPSSSYAGEAFFAAARPGRPPFALRCLLPGSPATSTSADCQRDFHAGKDLSILYRFSAKLLPEWQAIDASLESFIRDRLVP